mgnify:CR=1 FL=1
MSDTTTSLYKTGDAWSAPKFLNANRSTPTLTPNRYVQGF